MSYYKLIFENTEPLRIADAATAQSGQTETLDFIPGSTIRGLMIGTYLKLHSDAAQETIDGFLSSGMSFFNAYVQVDGKELIPSLKGFYEPKGDVGMTEAGKEIHSVLKDGTVPAGEKRASLGRYCMVEDQTIRFLTPAKGADLKINLGKAENATRTVFRDQNLKKGYRFVSYLKAERAQAQVLEECLNEVRKQGEFYLGASRGSGLGRCEVVSCKKVDQIPYSGVFQKKDMTGTSYMVLLSQLGMVDAYGENTGLSLPELEEALGVSDLKLSYCATSVSEVCGFNRKWQTFTPSVKMYDSGSVFKLEYTGTLTVQKQEEILGKGLGVRRNEGYGRVLFLDSETYDRIGYKKKLEAAVTAVADTAGKASKEDQEIIRLAVKSMAVQKIASAREKFLEGNPGYLGGTGMSKAQIGSLRSIVSTYRYAPDTCREQLKAFFANISQKQGANKTHSMGMQINMDKLEKKIWGIFGDGSKGIYEIEWLSDCRSASYGPFSISDLLTREELDKECLQTLQMMIERNNREAR